MVRMHLREDGTYMCSYVVHICIYTFKHVRVSIWWVYVCVYVHLHTHTHVFSHGKETYIRGKETYIRGKEMYVHLHTYTLVHIVHT